MISKTTPSVFFTIVSSALMDLPPIGQLKNAATARHTIVETLAYLAKADQPNPNRSSTIAMTVEETIATSDGHAFLHGLSLGPVSFCLFQLLRQNVPIGSHCPS